MKILAMIGTMLLAAGCRTSVTLDGDVRIGVQCNTPGVPAREKMHLHVVLDGNTANVTGDWSCGPIKLREDGDGAWTLESRQCPEWSAKMLERLRSGRVVRQSDGYAVVIETDLVGLNQAAGSTLLCGLRYEGVLK